MSLRYPSNVYLHDLSNWVNQLWLTTLIHHGAHQSSRHQSMPHEKTTYSIYFHIKSLLVGGFNPSEKWWSSSVGMLIQYYSQLFMESHSKFHGSSHHQPDFQIASFIGIPWVIPLVLSSIVCSKLSPGRQWFHGAGAPGGDFPARLPYGFPSEWLSLTISINLYLINIYPL